MKSQQLCIGSQTFPSRYGRRCILAGQRNFCQSEQGQTASAEEEMGDLLFALVNASRFLKINPEDALRRGVAKFERRFRAVEAAFEAKGRRLNDASLEEMDAVWDRIKAQE